MAYLRKKKGRYYAVFYDADRQPKEKWIPTGTGLKDAARRVFHDLERRRLDPHDGWDPWAPKQAPSRLTLQEGTERFLEGATCGKPHRTSITRS